MMRHDSLRLRSRAFMNVRVGLLTMDFAMVVAMTFAVVQATTPQYLFLTTSVPNGQASHVPGIMPLTA
jgi:hypothetical protein